MVTWGDDRSGGDSRAVQDFQWAACVFLLVWCLGSDHIITIKLNKCILYPQGSLNSPVQSFVGVMTHVSGSGAVFAVSL